MAGANPQDGQIQSIDWNPRSHLRQRFIDPRD
jgi:hypothetical protein